jgi:hypothetical protein
MPWTTASERESWANLILATEAEMRESIFDLLHANEYETDYGDTVVSDETWWDLHQEHDWQDAEAPGYRVCRRCGASSRVYP